MSSGGSALPDVGRQAERLIALGVHKIGGVPTSLLRAAEAGTGDVSSLLVIHQDRVPASALVSMLELNGKRGFVVVDMPDVDDFAPIRQVDLPSAPVYRVEGVERGDHLANWSPNEALTSIVGAGRTPLTVGEGIHWLLQQPDALARGHCFMTIGSRLRRPNGSLDARTPALWISNGTGRDGRENRNAPKLGWCWAGNRHSWLGFASASRRVEAAG